MEINKILQELDTQFEKLEALGLEPSVIICHKDLYDELIDKVMFSDGGRPSNRPQIKKAQFVMDIIVSDHLEGINVYANPKSSPSQVGGMRIPKDDLAALPEIGTVICPDDGNTYLYLPYWFKDTGDFYETMNWEHLPEELIVHLDVIRNKVKS